MAPGKAAMVSGQEAIWSHGIHTEKTEHEQDVGPGCKTLMLTSSGQAHPTEDQLAVSSTTFPNNTASWVQVLNVSLEEIFHIQTTDKVGKSHTICKLYLMLSYIDFANAK